MCVVIRCFPSCKKTEKHCVATQKHGCTCDKHGTTIQSAAFLRGVPVADHYFILNNFKVTIFFPIAILCHSESCNHKTLEPSLYCRLAALKSLNCQILPMLRVNFHNSCTGSDVIITFKIRCDASNATENEKRCLSSF